MRHIYQLPEWSQMVAQLDPVTYTFGAMRVLLNGPQAHTRQRSNCICQDRSDIGVDRRIDVGCSQLSSRHKVKNATEE